MSLNSDIWKISDNTYDIQKSPSRSSKEIFFSILSKSHELFSSLKVKVKSDSIYFISYLFHDELNDSTIIYVSGILDNYYGTPDTFYSYTEHLLKHNISCWNLSDFKISYDYGEIDQNSINDNTDSAKIISSRMKRFPLCIKIEKKE